MHFRGMKIPEPAQEYLDYLSTCRSKNTVNLYRSSIGHFHRFLAQIRKQIIDLDLDDIKEFSEDLARHNLKLVTRKNILLQVRIYLQHLADKSLLPDGLPAMLFPNYRGDCVKRQIATLPELGDKFLKVMSATYQPSTVNGYQTVLRKFYKLQWTGRRSLACQKTLHWLTHDHRLFVGQVI